MDIQFLRPFIAGTMTVFKVQCFSESRPGDPFLKGTKPAERFDIAAVIGLTSNAFNGSITLCFPEKVFLGLMSNMLSEKFDTITPDLADGAAELLNIIFGQAKSVLNEKGYAIQKAIPNVVYGKQLESNAMAVGKVVVIPFQSDLGPFQIEIHAEGASFT